MVGTRATAHAPILAFLLAGCAIVVEDGKWTRSGRWFTLPIQRTTGGFSDDQFSFSERRRWSGSGGWVVSAPFRKRSERRQGQYEANFRQAIEGGLSFGQLQLEWLSNCKPPVSGHEWRQVQQCGGSHIVAVVARTMRPRPPSVGLARLQYLEHAEKLLRMGRLG
jgi:hypothetical protein